MKRLTTLLMTLMLMSAALWADQTVTVSANSSDISEGLDLKVVAKLFAEATNLEEFETMLNNPDSAFCNLDLNGDGQVDYLRVVETGEGNKRLIVLQAVLAKDIYQDVASIYVEKSEKDEVSVQVVGDEYVYGTNYIIEPVYIYRPVIYDWFWSDAWVAWNSPWYWGYYPGWWYVHNCWAHDWYWHHCYAFHRHHHHCSFRPGKELHHGYHDMHRNVGRRDYAMAHPDRAFASRNSGKTNAHEIRSTGAAPRQASGAGVANASSRSAAGSATNGRTYGSRNTAATRSETTTGAAPRTSAATTRSSATATRNSATATRGAETTNRSANTASATRSSAATTTRSNVSTNTRSNSATATRSSGSYTPTRSSNSSYSSGSTSGSSTRSSGSYSGGSYSGGRSSGGYSGGSSSGGRSSGSSGGSGGRRR